MNNCKGNKTGAIVYARMDSRRLPGKVLSKIGYHSRLLDYVIEALNTLSEIDIYIATSDRTIDLPLKEYAIENGLKYFLGSLDDVAKRTIDCCETFDLDYFIRVNGDSPFLNIPLIRKGLNFLKSEDYDIVSNLINRTHPYGISCEIIKVSTFKDCYPRFNIHEREHITSFFYKNLKELKFAQLPISEVDLSDIRLTIDTPEDKEAINNFIISNKLKNIYSYTVEDIAELFKKYTNKS